MKILQSGALGALVVVSGVAFAADWNEWRGPQRNGIVEKSPPLTTTFPEDGPKRLWRSEDQIPGGYNAPEGGLGSVVVAGNRAYVMVSQSRTEKLATRTLAPQKLTELGWTPKKPPAEMLKTAEEARVSPEREALKTPAELEAWAVKWLETNLSADQRKEFGPFLANRMKRGKAALSMELLDQLAAIKDQPFDSQAALDAWLTQNNLEGETRKTVQSKFADSQSFRDTGVYCLDAATGKTVWKKLFPGGPMQSSYAASSTPCVASGKVYALGVDGVAFCLDAKTGDTVWSAAAASVRDQKHCSFLVVDDVAIVPFGPLTGFDADKGTVLWKHDKFKDSWSSPVIWRKDGKTVVVVRAGGKLVGLDPKPGTILWSIDDWSPEAIYSGSTPAIDGDRMAVCGKSDVRLFRLAADKAEMLWKVDCPMDYCSSPTIYLGHVYVFGRAGATCLALEDGKVAWQDKEIKTGSYHSPILADGKFFVQGQDKKASGFGDGTLTIVAASPDKPHVLAEEKKIRQSLCATPAIVDGRIYCRLLNSIVCYDLRP